LYGIVKWCNFEALFARAVGQKLPNVAVFAGEGPADVTTRFASFLMTHKVFESVYVARQPPYTAADHTIGTAIWLAADANSPWSMVRLDVGIITKKRLEDSIHTCNACPCGSLDR
jgi:hypothetical protein